MFKCMQCGKEFDKLPQGLVRCPYCASRMLMKSREPVTKKIKAR